MDEVPGLAEQLRDLPEQYLLRVKTQEMVEAAADRLDVLEAVAEAGEWVIATQGSLHAEERIEALVTALVAARRTQEDPNG